LKRILLSLLVCMAALGGLAATSGDAGAASTRKLPSFELRDLQEKEMRLSDDQFKGKTLLIAAFGTWQEVSRTQARELEAFHKKHPEVEIIAFVVDALPAARDFVKAEGLTISCYKADASTRIGTAFNRLFETKKGKTITLNRLPFVILADSNRNVRFANLGPTDAESMSAEYAKIK